MDPDVQGFGSSGQNQALYPYESDFLDSEALRRFHNYKTISNKKECLYFVFCAHCFISYVA
jgi:hypothetical protein